MGKTPERLGHPGTSAGRFPPERAFVVHLSAAAYSSEPTSGRVEHVVSGRSVRFESLDALSQFFRAVLATEVAGGGPEDG
jgi:hypothetical protein